MSTLSKGRRAPASGANPVRALISLVLPTLAVIMVAAEAAPLAAPSGPAPGLLGHGALTAPNLSVSGPPPAPSLSTYGQLPLSFVANAGQVDARAAFVAHGRGYTLFVSPTETVFVARPPAPAGQGLADRLRSGRGTEPSTGPADDTPRAVVHMRLVGADASAVMTGEEQSGRVNYLIGSDRSRWRTGVRAYARVRSRGVYPGVDLVFYGNGRQLEYDFILAPGSDPRSIRLAFDGIAAGDGRPALHVDTEGDLVLRTAAGDLRLRKPVAYQEIGGVRHPVTASFALRTARASTPEPRPEVGIDVAAYDPSRPLVIDPIFNYSIYLGGSGSDAGMGVTVDANGSAYVAGYTESPDFPGAIPGPNGPAPAGGSRKAFIAKLNPTGTGLMWATYLGGDGHDAATAIAVDPPCRTDPAVPCNVYVTGMTDSTNFPTVNPYQTNQGGTDAFVTKLDPSGSAILYSTYLGGGPTADVLDPNVILSGTDVGLGIAVGFGANDTGQIYVTGYTESGGTFPKRSNFQAAKGGAEAFVTKFNPNLAGTPSLIYSSPLGGTGRDEGHAIAVDALGQAHVTGFTESTECTPPNSCGFPLQGRFQPDQPGTDAFVTKVRADGKAKLYSTYVGGNGTDVGLGIAVDPTGKIYITGYTDSTNLPVCGVSPWTCASLPYQSNLQGGGGTDAFVMKLDPTVANAGSLLYSTYLGGPGGSVAGLAIAVGGPDGHVYVTGYTDSANFPTANAAQGYGGGRDAFLARIAIGAGGSQLMYSTYVGGSGADESYGVAVDGTGAAYITGLTHSGNFPTVPANATALGGEQDAFVAKLNESPPDLTVSGLSATISGGSVTVTETTANGGNLTTGRMTTTSYYLSADSAGPGVPLGSRTVPTLGAGASSTASTTVPVPAGTVPGSYFIIAKADANNDVTESNEGNNTASTARTLGVGGVVDLRIDGVDIPGQPVNFATPPAGASFDITIHTKNDSPAPAPASTTKVYLLLASALNAPPMLIGSRGIPQLGPNATDVGAARVTLPAGVTGAGFVFAK